MNLEELKRLKKEKGFTNEDLAEVSGVPLGTVQRIMSGATKNPRRDTWEALERALGVLNDGRYSGEENGYGSVQESLSAYAANSGKRQGEYTIEDLHKLPEDVKAELIDGVIYYFNTPKTFHQFVAGEIREQISICIKKSGKKCMVLEAAGVQIDCNDKTMMIPDVALICDKEKILDSSIFGAPDFVAEVLSPSTRKRDMSIKFQKYLAAGVSVYWMVDVKKRQIITYDFTDEEFTPEIHSLEGTVRLTLPEGECEIDFDYMSEMLKEVYGL